jgi:uncharacterized protein YukE
MTSGHPVAGRAEYGGATIRVSPRALYHLADDVSEVVTEVADSLAAVMRTLDGLSISWIGSSASAAKDFGDRWSTAMVELFGKPKDKATGAGGKAGAAEDRDDGVLNAFAGGLALAAGNFDQAEEHIFKVFMQFASMGSDSGSGSRSSSSQNLANTDLTAITEIFP